MPKLLALGAELVLSARLEPVGVLGERPELGEPCLGRRSVPRQGLMAFPSGLGLPPGRTCFIGRELRVAVEEIEPVRRPREPALLELPAHRDQRLRCSGDILAGGRATPRIGACASVGEDPAREDKPVLALGPELGERAELLLGRRIELRLDIGLVSGCTDQGAVTTRAEQQPERARQDRLAGTGLPRDRVQAPVEIELGVLDQHQVRDPQALQHPCECYGRCLPALIGRRWRRIA